MTVVLRKWGVPVIWIDRPAPYPELTAAAETVWRATVVQTAGSLALPPGSDVTTEEEE